MLVKFITKSIHAYLDYPVALTLMVAPFLLGLGESHAAALWLSVATSTAAFVLTVLTDHHLGVFRVLPYSVHLAVDGAVGASFLFAPMVFGFEGLDAYYYWANGLAVAIVVGLHKAEPEAV
ncbi:hypothetical protein GG681_11265 [Epibacterium sp. SM1969]|uniref:SPW repeat-containing protein n=1 Tax=Tritonibacter aquimaris TaxID=2663379 RepID=A0A844AZ58_9RHOB|nr:hypothetical protein [Tritonibacter aquimaris]MQY43221.1 hypothetical protein [Tritonibacter aquimaris]